MTAAVRAPTISVALCTYNGAPYLAEQLSSIGGQTRTPDEVVVCDDGSTDRSGALVADFARSVAFPVVFHVNPTRLGSTKNFERAISCVTGDIVALSDQDDVWRSDKLATLEREFARTEIGGAFTDARLTDAGGRVLPSGLWSTGDFTGACRRRFADGDAFGVLMRHRVVTGATLAFRTAFRPLLLPIAASSVHDAWIALLLSAVTTLVAIDEPLIDYRQHGGNQIGAVRRSAAERLRATLTPIDRARLSAQAEWLGEALQRLRVFAPWMREPTRLDELSALVAHIEHRATLPSTVAGRFQRVRRELATGGYSRFGSGIKSAARDLVL